MKKALVTSEFLWKIGGVLVFAGTYFINLGGAFYGGPADWRELLVTLGYILFWLLFTRYAGMPRGCMWMSILSLAANLTGFWAQAMGPYNIPVLPAIILHPFSGAAMYGFRFWLDWNGTYMVGTILSGLWLGWNIWRRKS